MPPVDRHNPIRAISSESDFSLMEFMREFPDDQSCLEHLWRARYSDDGEHADCPKCGREQVPFRKYATAQGRQSWTCTQCGHHVHPTAGTIFQVVHVASALVLRHVPDDQHSLRDLGQAARARRSASPTRPRGGC